VRIGRFSEVSMKIPEHLDGMSKRDLVRHILDLEKSLIEFVSFKPLIDEQTRRLDTLGAATMIKRLKMKLKILGDKGYDSEPLHELAQEKGSILYAPVRNMARKIPKGRNRKRCAKGDEDYTKRNIVESIFHSLKAVRVTSLKCKKHYLKKREMALYGLVFNIEKMNKAKA
jgi:transposase